MTDEITNIEQQNETPKEIAVYKGDDIRDKKLADAESATTAESGDSVVLKTTAGTYVEIDRNSFAEVMREELGRLIKGTADKGASINSVAAMDASNDLGWISPANLATVLGVPSNLFRNTKINMPYSQDSLKTNVSIQNNVGFIIIMNQDGNAASSGKMTVYAFGGTWAYNGDRYIKTIATEGSWGSHSVTYSSDNYIVITKNNSSLNGMILSLS